jgi:hypothetical protein
MKSVSSLPNNMILLFGMPRSGTTWIGKMFDSHPGVSYRHEPDSQFRMDNVLPLLADISAVESYRAGLETYCAKNLPRCSPRTCGKGPRFPKDTENAITRQIQQATVTMAKALERLAGRPLSWNSRPRGRLVWKSIESLGRLGVLLRVFQNSRGIMIVRDPRGYAASVMRGESQGRFVSSNSVANDWGLFELLCRTPYAQQCNIDLEQLQQDSPERRLAWLWILFNQKAMDDIADIGNGRMVRYEDLCARPAQEFQALFDFCGLDWDQQTQGFLTASTTQAKNDYYSVYKDPLASANKWQSDLSGQQAESIRTLVTEHPVGRWYLDQTSGTDR